MGFGMSGQMIAAFFYCSGTDNRFCVLAFQTGFIMAGFVKQIMPFGCFIGFPGGLLGLAPLRVRRPCLLL